MISLTAIPDAYVTAYFAERKPKIELLTAPWPRTNFSYTTQMSIDSWRIPNDVWDFELTPWIAKGKLATSTPMEIKGTWDRVGVRGPSDPIVRRPDGTQIWPMPH